MKTLCSVFILVHFVIHTSAFQHSVVRKAARTLKVASSTIDAARSLETRSDELSKERFNWNKNWYPIVPVEFLDIEKPHKFKLFNQDIVVWKDALIQGATKESSKKDRVRGAKKEGGEWRAFIDECPHRRVPLSEGRVEDDGTLLCSYHGWRYDGNGACRDVPQISEPKTMEQVMKNTKNQCNSFPAQVIDGVLWVWPETGEDARIESALKPAKNFKVEGKIEDDRIWFGPWNFRELPYGADYFIENVVDPAHVEVSHHGITGNRYANLQQKVGIQKKNTKEGFEILSETKGLRGTTEFRAPSSVVIQSPFGNGAKQVLELYATPSRPGFCMHIGRQVMVKDNDGKMPKFLRQFTLPMPIWFNHVIAAVFLNQDALFLHAQERNLASSGRYSTNENDAAGDDFAKLIVPIETDLGVVSYRSWLKKYAGGLIPYKNRPSMPQVDNSVVFDQWNSHTKHCKYCLGALKNIRRIRFAAFTAAILLGLLRPMGRIPTLFGVVLSGGIGLGMNALVSRFYSYEYSHSSND